MMYATDVVVLALALAAVLVAWFHEDSFLASWRSRTELWDNWLERLLNCRLCLSIQAPFWLLIAPFYLPSLFLPDPWNHVIRLPIYSFAATTLAWAFLGALNKLIPYFGLKEPSEGKEDEPAPQPLAADYDVSRVAASGAEPDVPAPPGRT